MVIILGNMFLVIMTIGHKPVDNGSQPGGRDLDIYDFFFALHWILGGNLDISVFCSSPMMRNCIYVCLMTCNIGSEYFGYVGMQSGIAEHKRLRTTGIK